MTILIRKISCAQFSPAELKATRKECIQIHYYWPDRLSELIIKRDTYNFYPHITGTSWKVQQMGPQEI